MKTKLRILFLVLAAVVAFTITLTNPAVCMCPGARNLSTITLCAEEDNVNIPIYGKVTRFVVEATHPSYAVSYNNCEADFTDCQPSTDPKFPFPPGVFKLFDDGETVVEAVREAYWWRPNGMRASVNDGVAVTDIHYIRVYRKIADSNEWPQFFVLYMDGNMRLIPHPPFGFSHVCFGSSVIIGPAEPARRPMAEISSVRYVSSSKTLEIFYKDQGKATLALDEVSRTLARVRVAVDYPTAALPFTTFRSMFVAAGNADADHIMWRNPNGAIHADGIMAFTEAVGTDWLFYRQSFSKHNTSAPDIRIKVISFRADADSDQDCDVDGTDLSAFAAWYSAGNLNADLDADGDVDTADLAAFASAYGV